MQLLAILVVLAVSGCHGFLASSHSNRNVAARNLILRRPMADEGDGVDLVPIDKTTIENSVAVTGGVLGFVLGGPVVGLIFAAVTNDVSKKENEPGRD